MAETGFQELAPAELYKLSPMERREYWNRLKAYQKEELKRQQAKANFEMKKIAAQERKHREHAMYLAMGYALKKYKAVVCKIIMAMALNSEFSQRDADDLALLYNDLKTKHEEEVRTGSKDENLIPECPEFKIKQKQKLED